MPYRRRYASRRRYGGRRMYRRSRRPNIARSTLKGRLTMAPRHQYLKLKRVLSFNEDNSVAPAAQDQAWVNLWLQAPNYYTTYTTTNYAADYTFIPVGWEAYNNLFTKFVVAGVKIKMTFCSVGYNRNASSAKHDTSFYVAINRSAFDIATVPAQIHEVEGGPYGEVHSVTPDKPLTLKRYVNMNSLFGEVVKKHDAYVHNWASVAAPTTPATSAQDPGIFQIVMVSAGKLTGAQRDYFPSVRVQMTYFVHAISSNTFGDATALALAKANTVAGNPFGEDVNNSSYLRAARDNHQIPQNKGILRAVSNATN